MLGKRGFDCLILERSEMIVVSIKVVSFSLLQHLLKCLKRKHEERLKLFSELIN